MPARPLLLFTLAIAEAAMGAPPSSPAAMQAVADATGAALQVDAARAIRRLREVPAGSFNGRKEFRSCSSDSVRAVGAAGLRPSGPFARRVLRAYQVYWRAALLQSSARPTAEAALFVTLQRLLGRDDLADMDALEPELATRLAQSGNFSLQGMTGPLRELMLWSKQETRTRSRPLPEERTTTKVMLLR
jgi:hypothetical protein